MRNELLELYVIYQAKLLHARDASQWTAVFQTTAQRLLSVLPLQSLTKVQGAIKQSRQLQWLACMYCFDCLCMLLAAVLVWYDILQFEISVT